jgi:hypothetical protein
MRTYLIAVSMFSGLLASGQNTIKSYEYWFNGNYAAVQKQNVSPTASFTLNTLIPASTLPDGLHLFNLRFKDDSARYSSTISQFFYKYATGSSSPANVNAYQYWFNSNFDAATFQAVSSTATINLNTLVNTANLANGLHLFHIRFRDNLGQWSTIVSQFFYKAETPVAGVRKINGYQYWFDNGYPSAQLQAVTPITTMSVNAPIAAETLSNGLHLFHIRFRDDAGNWSTVVSQFFYKAEPLPTPGTNLITGYQYWFNSDFANAGTTAITPVSPYQLSAPINTNALSKGMHLLHIRFKDQRGQWSVPISQFIYTMSAADVTQPNAMGRMQYWFGSDMANAQVKPLPQQKMVQVTELLDANALGDGLHLLHLRFADTVGNWSSTISQFFYKSKEFGITNNVITGYRYWFNDAPAANIVYHQVSPTNPFDFITVLDMGCLAAGDNRIQLQFRDSAGQWSAPLVDTVNVTPPSNKTFRFVGNGNWSNDANWLNNAKPSLDAPSCREIIIDHTAGGNCILDVPQHLLKNAKLNVMPGKHLIIPNNIETKASANTVPPNSKPIPKGD